MDEREMSDVMLFRYDAVCRVQALLDCEESLSVACQKVAEMLATAPVSHKRPKAKTVERWYYAYLNSVVRQSSL